MPSDPVSKTQEAPSDPKEEIQEVLLEPEQGKEEVPSDSEEETQDEAGTEAELTDLGETVVLALWKLTISDNLPPRMSSRTRSQRGHTSVEGAAFQMFPSTTKEVGEKGDEESMLVCDGGGSMALQVKMDMQEPITGDISPELNTRQQGMDSPK